MDQIFVPFSKYANFKYLKLPELKTVQLCCGTTNQTATTSLTETFTEDVSTIEKKIVGATIYQMKHFAQINSSSIFLARVR